MVISMGLELMNFGRSHMALIAARKDANEPSLPLPLHASHRRPSYNLLLSKIHHVAISNKFEIWARDPIRRWLLRIKGSKIAKLEKE